MLLACYITHLALYLSHLLDKKKVSAVSMAHAALKWVHSILPSASNPIDVGLCKNLVEAEKRSRREPVKKMEPVSLELIKSIVNK